MPLKQTRDKLVRLEIKPHRRVGAHTKLRFRYFLGGTGGMTVFDVADQDNRHIHMTGLKEGRLAVGDPRFHERRQAERRQGNAFHRRAYGR